MVEFKSMQLEKERLKKEIKDNKKLRLLIDTQKNCWKCDHKGVYIYSHIYTTWYNRRKNFNRYYGYIAMCFQCHSLVVVSDTNSLRLISGDTNPVVYLNDGHLLGSSRYLLEIKKEITNIISLPESIEGDKEESKKKTKKVKYKYEALLVE